MPGKSRRGLTLWEVLAAAGIMALIALLGAFLLPLRMRERGSKRWVCASNAHLLYVAARIYADDYDLRLPPAEIEVRGTVRTLPAILDLYVRDGRTWSCPRASERGRTEYGFSGGPDDATVSYGYNWLAPNGRGIRLDQAKKPEETLLLVETTSYRAVPAGLRRTRLGTVPAYPHQEHSTVAWLDGRAAYLLFGQLEQLDPDRGNHSPGGKIDAYRYWNRH